MSSIQLKKSTKKKCRVGFECLILMFVALAALAISGVMVLSSNQTLEHGDQRFKEQALMAPPIRKKELRTPKAGLIPGSSIAKGHEKNKLKPTVNISHGQPQGAKQKVEASSEANDYDSVRQSTSHNAKARSIKENSILGGAAVLEQENKPEEASESRQSKQLKSPRSTNHSMHTSNENADRHSKIHVVFSTSCHVKQDWQSYLFFYSAMAHDQQGTVTRIVSGCEPEDKAKLSRDFQEKIAIMSDRFLLHFTPDYGRLPGKNYQKTKYWNKP
jgi:hypothetical protein